MRIGGETPEERLRRVRLETTGATDEMDELRKRIEALERAVAKLAGEEAKEVRRIRAALDSAEAPQSKDRES